MKSLQSPFHNSFSFNYVMCRIDGNAYMCHHQYYLDARKTPFCILQLTIGNNMRHVGFIGIGDWGLKECQKRRIMYKGLLQETEQRE